MAFFGSDASDKELARLKKVMNQKDLQLTSLQNEHQKRQEEISELRKARDTAIYDLQVEADRAYKAEKALALRTQEIIEAKLRLDNQESSLNAANERIKAEQKENQKLQYQLDLLSAGSSQSSSKRVQDQEGALKAQIKQLEQDLKRSENEKETIKHEAAATSVGGWGLSDPSVQARTGIDKAKVISMENEISSLRSENVKLMEELRNIQSGPPTSTSSIFGSEETESSGFGGGSPRPSSMATSASSSSRTRRRASSVSMIPQLQAEIQELRLQTSNTVSFSELENIKIQLAAAKKQANKMENEKMALERKARNEADDLRSKLDDAQDEINFFRRAEDGTGSLQDKKEKEALRARVDVLQAELQSKTKEIHNLELQLVSLAAVKSALAEERSKVVDLESRVDTAAPVATSNASGEPEAKILSLEQQLSAASSTSKDSTSDRKVRQLQRDLSGLEEELKESDRLLAEKEKEIFSLRSCLPIPVSPTLGSSSDDTENAELARLQIECEAQRLQITEMSARIEELEDKLEQVGLLASAKETALQALQAEFSVKSEELGSSKEKSQELTQQISALQADLEEHQLKAASTKAQLDEGHSLRDHLAQSQLAFTAAQSEVTRIAAQLRDQTQLAQELETVRGELSRRTHDDTEYEAVAASASLAVRESQEARVALQEVRTTLAEIQASCETLRIQRDEAVETTETSAALIQQLRNNLAAEQTQQQGHEARLQGQLTDAEGTIVSLKLDLGQLHTALESEKTNFHTLETHRDTLLKEHTAISAELATLQENLANRSTDSEAQEREITLFQKGEEVKTLATRLQEQHTDFSEEIKLIAREKEVLVTANAELSGEIKSLSEDLASLPIKVVTLQTASDQKQAPASEEVDQLLDAIERLRHERDQLRQSLTFANHLKHFALEASGADAASALVQLKDIKAELAATRDAKAALELELKSLAASEAEVSERQIGAEPLPTLKTVEGSATELALKSNGISEELVLEQQARLAAESLAEQRLSELEEARASAGEDVRQLLAERLSASVKTTDSAARQLKKDLDEQVQRVIRRDAQIATHQAEIKRLKLNRDLMESSMEDLNEELSSMAARVEGASVPAPDIGVLSAAQAESTSLRQALATASGRIESLETQLSSLHVDQKTALAVANSLTASDHQLVRSLIVNAVITRADLTSKTELVRSLAADRRLWALQMADHLPKNQVRVPETGAFNRELQQGAHDQQPAVSAETITLDEKPDNISTELAAAHSQIVELDAESVAAIDLIQSLRDEKSGVESELEALVTELAELEASSHQERLALTLELENVREQNAEAKAEATAAKCEAAEVRDRLNSASETLEATRGQLASQMTAAEEVRGQLAVAHQASQELEEQIAIVRRKIEHQAGELADAYQTISGLRASHEDSRTSLGTAESAKAQAVSDLAGVRAELDKLRSENNVFQTSLQEAQSTAASSLGEQDRLLKALEAAIEEKVASESSLADVTVLSEQLQAFKLSEAELTERLSQIEVELADAQTTIKELNVAEADTRAALETATAETASVQQQLVASQAEMSAIAVKYEQELQTNVSLQARLVASRDELDSLCKELSAAQKESKQATGLLKFEESKAKNLSRSLQAAHANLEVAQKEAADAVSQARSIHISVSKLTAENGRLLSALETKAKSQEQNDLPERISQLEAVLNQKMQEVDEADDKVRDAYKTNARLEKKVAKLERKLAVSASPAIVPVVAATETSRTPRSINVFEPVPVIAGGKRSREEPDVEQLPAEAVFQPPSTTPGRTPMSVRRALAARHPGFTPTRRVSGEAGLKSTTPARTPASRAAFGADITNGLKVLAEAPKSEGKAQGLPRNAFSVL